MHADPSCKRQAIGPTWCKAKFAVEPLWPQCRQYLYDHLLCCAHIKIPNATHNCQPMTKVPLTVAGEFSAANTGTVLALVPIPIPNKQRQANSSGQFLVKAEPITEPIQNTAEMKIVPRRPRVWLIGCDIQQPLSLVSAARDAAHRIRILPTTAPRQSKEPR